MRYFQHDGLKGTNWERFPYTWIVPAIFMMPVAIHLVCVPILYEMNGHQLPWQPWLTRTDQYFHTPESRNWGTLTPSELTMRILLNAFGGLVVVCALVFFEEIGWRAWMMPKLLGLLPARQALVAGALIWALWHVPFLLCGILYIPGLSLTYALALHPIGIFGSGLVINWFWLRTRSIWIVVLAHGALNNWGQYAFKFMQDTRQSHIIWLFSGVNGTLLLLGLILVCTVKRNVNPPTAEPTSN